MKFKTRVTRTTYSPRNQISPAYQIGVDLSFSSGCCAVLYFNGRRYCSRIYEISLVSTSPSAWRFVFFPFDQIVSQFINFIAPIQRVFSCNYRLLLFEARGPLSSFTRFLSLIFLFKRENWDGGRVMRISSKSNTYVIRFVSLFLHCLRSLTHLSADCIVSVGSLTQFRTVFQVFEQHVSNSNAQRILLLLSFI